MKKWLVALVLALLPALASAQGAGDSIIRYYPPAATGGVTVGGNNAWTGANSFLDANFSLLDDVDNTKIAKFQVSGITTGTTRTFTFPNVTGTIFTSGGNNFQSAGQLVMGSDQNQYPSLYSSTAQTPDTGLITTGNLANNIIIAEAADKDFDFAHALATDPTLFIHSRNQSTTQWLSLSHDGTNARLNTGTGTFQINNWISGSTGLLAFFGDGTNTYVREAVAGKGVQLSDSAGSVALYLQPEANATLQLGQDVNGAATNQTLKAHDGITGTDIKGASLTLASGLGTGAAASNPLTLNRQITKATGTTAQTYAPAVVVCPHKVLSTTSATAQTIATITTTTTTGGSVTVDYGNVACSGTTCDADSGIVKVSWNNNAGTVAAAMTAVTLQSDSDATGTLAATPTATVATNVVSIKLTPTWVTIVPTSVWASAIFHVFSLGDTVTCQ